jgi:hypothetical protein
MRVLGAQNAIEPRPTLTCTPVPIPNSFRNQFITQLRKHLIDNSTVADLRCSIVEGIESWLLKRENNKPESTDPTLQIGWFGVIKGIIKGYIPNQWNKLQTAFFRSQ